MRLLRPLALGACLAGLLLSPARALTDPHTGFGIEPPAPFTVEVSPPQGEDLAFSLRSSTGAPPAAGTGALCRVGLKLPVPGLPADQAAFNARIDDKKVREEIRKPLKPRYSIESETEFDLKGARGVQFIGIPKAGPNADQVRVVLSFVETPRGRVSLVCATPAASLEAALPAFSAIRSSILLPR